MTAGERKNLENIVEQKMLEFFGDPDSGLELKKSFKTKLGRRMGKKQKLTPALAVAKKYGIR